MSDYPAKESVASVQVSASGSCLYSLHLDVCLPSPNPVPQRRSGIAAPTLAIKTKGINWQMDYLTGTGRAGLGRHVMQRVWMSAAHGHLPGGARRCEERKGGRLGMVLGVQGSRQAFNAT